jgi:hypothetical protein
MGEDGYLWGDASVSYPDWQGTAQLDQRMTSAGIEELVGLDPDEWSVIGVVIGGGESGLHPLEVVAVHTSVPMEDRRPDESLFDAMARAGGELPATHFRVHEADAFELLLQVMHVFDFRLRSRGVVGVPIRIMSQADLPEKFMQD